MIRVRAFVFLNAKCEARSNREIAEARLIDLEKDDEGSQTEFGAKDEDTQPQ
jgi:hypothetical protein